MLQTPFRFETELSAQDFQKLGQLAMRWSHIEHVMGNCLRTMLRLSMDEATTVIFPLSTEQRQQKLRQLAKVIPLSADATLALTELLDVWGVLGRVRNDAIHGIMIEDHPSGQVFENRSKGRELTKEQVFACEELTNYAAHAVLSLRYALGDKGEPWSHYPLPEKPQIPAFLRT